METPERIVYISWKAPARLFKKRDKDFFRNIAAIVFLLLVILFFAKEFPLILAVVSITFLVYVFSTVPPEEVKHTVTSRGIETEGKDYSWGKLTSFWFEHQWDQDMVIVQDVNGLRLTLLVDSNIKDELKEIMNRFIRYEEDHKKTFVDNAASWLSEKIPLEKPAS